MTTPTAGSSTPGHIDRELAHLIDHTALKPEATVADIERLCREAKEYGFASVCVNPAHVARCRSLLQGSGVAVCTVIGFPLGATTTTTKVFETEEAVRDGAREVDMVINIGMLKSGDHGYVERDIAAVVRAAHQHHVLTKVIIETALLTEAEKQVACHLAAAAGADFVKTSTGFSTAGATVEDVALMRAAVGDGIGIKAAGGIRTRDQAQAMVRSGATRIGASASVTIVTEPQANRKDAS